MAAQELGGRHRRAARASGRGAIERALRRRRPASCVVQNAARCHRPPSAGSHASTFSVSPAQPVKVPGQGLSARTCRSMTSRIARPVDLPVLARQLRRIGRAFLRLRPRGRVFVERAQDRAAPRARPARRAASRRWCAARSARVPQQHRAGVQPRVHAHDGDAGLGVAGQDRRLDRRRAAPARQQARMDVQAAPPGRRQHRRRQDQPVGGDHRGIRAPAPRRPPAPRRRAAAAPACAPVRPSSSAATCTGHRRSAWPRPAGRGGWQYTAAIVVPRRRAARAAPGRRSRGCP